jgi:hypothetical protein
MAKPKVVKKKPVGIGGRMTPAQRRKYMENVRQELHDINFYERGSPQRKRAMNAAGNNPYERMRKSLAKDNAKYKRRSPSK